MAAMVALYVVRGPSLEIVAPTDFTPIAEKLTGSAVWIILLSGALAGWLMGLLSWLLTAARDTISQIVLVWLVAAMIVFAVLLRYSEGARGARLRRMAQADQKSTQKKAEKSGSGEADLN